jgi:hypothetical protein
MPKRFERHGRSSWEWGTPGSRHDELTRAVKDDPAKKVPPGKKNPSLCKATHWKGSHQPELRLHALGWRRPVTCQWDISWRSKNGEPSWHCNHDEVCAGCGKVLRISISEQECPDFHPITSDERAAIEAKQAENDARMAAAVTKHPGRWRKPVITGPQGYRRKG